MKCLRNAGIWSQNSPVHVMGGGRNGRARLVHRTVWLSADHQGAWMWPGEDTADLT